MRLLSDRELDEVLGGIADQTSALTLSSVNVNATAGANMNVVWSLAANGITPLAQADSSTNTPCYAAYYHAVDKVPTFAHLRCLTAHTTVPGYDLLSNVDIILLNAFASAPVTSSNSIDLTQVRVGNSQNYPDGHTLLSGLYQSNQAYTKVTMTANGIQPLAVPVSYIDVQTKQSMTWNAGMTAEQHTAFTLAHEASHEHGITDENQANGYGIYAVKQLDKLPAGTCP